MVNTKSSQARQKGFHPAKPSNPRTNNSQRDQRDDPMSRSVSREEDSAQKRVTMTRAELSRLVEAALQRALGKHPSEEPPSREGEERPRPLDHVPHEGQEREVRKIMNP